VVLCVQHGRGSPRIRRSQLWALGKFTARRGLSRQLHPSGRLSRWPRKCAPTGPGRPWDQRDHMRGHQNQCARWTAYMCLLYYGSTDCEWCSRHCTHGDTPRASHACVFLTIFLCMRRSLKKENCLGFLLRPPRHRSIVDQSLRRLGYSLDENILDIRV